MKNANKTMTSLLLAGILSLGMISCGEAKKNEGKAEEATEMHADHDGNMHGDHESMHGDNTEGMKGEETAMQTKFKDEKTAAVFNAYIALKDALVATDATAAAAAAGDLAGKAEGNETLSAAANTIAESNDVEAQRKAFAEVTAAMSQVLEGALASGEVYKQYCPMAFNNTGGSWFSNNKEIMNPYFGDKMLHCGTVKETIK